MALRDALPKLGSTLSVADRTRVLLNAQDRNGDSSLHAAVKASKFQVVWLGSVCGWGVWQPI